MPDVPTARTARTDRTERYEIRIAGHLAGRWAACFDGMTLTTRDDGTTVIHGPVADQSALHGLLHRLSDLGLPLISVLPVPTDPSDPTRSTS